MKKIIYVIALMLLIPTVVYAAPDEATVASKRAEMQEHRDEMIQQKTAVKALIQTKEELRAQTKVQIQESRQEVRQLKIQMVSSFQTMKDLTPEEREELKDEIRELKDEIGDIHAAELSLRASLREEILDINAEITEIVSSKDLNEEDVEEIDDIVSEL